MNPNRCVTRLLLVLLAVQIGAALAGCGKKVDEQPAPGYYPGQVQPVRPQKGQGGRTL
jgi:hypothetical protein